MGANQGVEILLLLLLFWLFYSSFNVNICSSQFLMMLPNSPSPDPYLSVPDLIDGAPFSFMRDLRELLVGVQLVMGRG
jgi:hypothetical protein